MKSIRQPEPHEILQNVPLGVIIIDENRQIIYTNPRIEQLIGSTSEQLRGKSICTVGLGVEQNSCILSDDVWWEWTEKAAVNMRAVFKTGRGELLHVFITGKRIITDNGTGHLYIGIMDLSNIDGSSVNNKSGFLPRESYHGLIGHTPQMQDIFSLIDRTSSTDVNVIIQGESGTGKELVAAAIHKASHRNGNQIIRVNCAALSETLLESELFGHVKGAFTGAYKDRIGNFEAAHGGTIFLDEIGEISPAVQVKLLRVIQERVVVRVGDNREIPVDVRIIAATNKNLRFLVQQGAFRDDLFYRLNVFPIHLPSLRERKPDIPLLCSFFLEKYRKETGKHISSFSADTMRLLMSYCWPGNIRELENAIEHAFVLCQSEEIQVTDLPHELRITAVRDGICAERTAGISPVLHPVLTGPQKVNGRLDITRKQLETELLKHGGNKSSTARSLGISKVALWKKMKAMGL
jgi:PAS domain S-box-containing protein